MTIERPDRWSLEIRKCKTEVERQRWMNKQTGGGRVVGTVCALYRRAGIELSASLPPSPSSRAPKTNFPSASQAYYHQAALYNKATSPPVGAAAAKAKRHHHLLLLLTCVLMRHCALCSSAVHFGDLLFLLELFAQDCIWRCSALWQHPGDWSVCSLKLHEEWISAVIRVL